MKFSIATALLAATASALPTAQDSALEARQLGGSTRNDLKNGNSGSCPGVIFVFARGSTELGNLVSPRYHPPPRIPPCMSDRSYANLINLPGYSGSPSCFSARVQVWPKWSLDPGCRWCLHCWRWRERSPSWNHHCCYPRDGWPL